jgi:hypothetical protein
MQRIHDNRPASQSTPEGHFPPAKRGSDGTYLLLATAGFFLAWLLILPIRSFDPDEFQHAHAAWSTWKGLIPYRDFFEHHTPWYYYALRPLFGWFNVDGSFESARHFLIVARGISALLAILSVFSVVVLGRLLGNRKLGLWAGLLLVAQPVFFEKGIEIRPDGLALPFFLGGLGFLLRGLSDDEAFPPGRLGWFLSSGLGLGGAIMCTQKMLFVLPGLMVGLGIWALFAGPRRTPRILAVACCLLGVAVPGLLTWAFFSLQHGGAAFLANNFALNAGWKQVVHEQLLKTLETSWPVLILGLLGAGVALYRFFRGARRQYGELVLLSTLVGLIAGILVVPVAHRQYYFMLLPLVCLLAARGVLWLIERVAEKRHAWLLFVATIPLFVLPVLDLREAFYSRNDRQLKTLRQVFARTKPTDTVMDGWQGTGVFRPHAFYYYFLHEESVPMLARERVDAFLDALESGQTRPKLIAMDDNLLALGSRFVRFVRRNYISRDGFLYYLKGGPDDL